MTLPVAGLQARTWRAFSQWRAQPEWVVPGASFDLDFAGQRLWREDVRGRGAPYDLAGLLGQLTFTRASTGTWFDAAGVLQSAGTDVLRFDHDPATLVAKGVLIEGARTNSIANSTMVGAAAGAPGTLPAGWIYNVATPTQEVIGVGSEDGIAYVDVRFSGSNSFALCFTGNTDIVAANGQAWTQSQFLRLVGGSMTNLTITVNIIARTAAGGALAAYNSSPMTPTAAALRTQRYAYAGTTSDGTTGRIQPRLLFSAAGAFDITIRFGLPQLELGGFATAPIRTTGSTATRAADALSAAVGGWFNPSEGTLIIDGASYATGANNDALTISDGTTNNRHAVRMSGGGGAALAVTVAGGATTGSVSLGASVAANRLAYAYKNNDFAGSLNGGAAVIDTSGALPSGLTAANFGASYAGGNLFYGHLRRFACIPIRRTNADLPGLAA